MRNFTEIERKWVCSWDIPSCFRIISQSTIQRQYLSVDPEVRITHRITGNRNTYNLTIKGNGTIERKEIRLTLDKNHYDCISSLITTPPLLLETKSCLTQDGIRISVKHCVQLSMTFAEIEFNSLEDSRHLDNWEDTIPFFLEEVTNCPDYYVKNMWCKYNSL